MTVVIALGFWFGVAAACGVVFVVAGFRYLGWFQ